MDEELTTVNSQLKEKLDELAHSNNDLSNLMVSRDIATLFLDTQLIIKRFTPATIHLFNLISSDIGRPLRDIRQIFTGGDILADAQKVLDKLTPLKSEVYTESGDYYICHVLPYRTSDNHISGVVGRGSKFSITLAPADKKLTLTVTPEAEVLSDQTGVRKGAILLIDDDPGVLEAYQMFLELEEGFEITTATSPPEAFAVLKDLKPDLIITDFHLGHKDTGIDIVRVARERVGRTIPAILVSGDTGVSMGEIDIKNAQFFSKPLDAKELVRVAHQLLQTSTV